MGAAFRKEILDKIFQPFFTTKPQDKAPGLGYR
jgi:C4-dicarboxylate-specific signal transduction histidine kinase